MAYRYHVYDNMITGAMSTCTFMSESFTSTVTATETSSGTITRSNKRVRKWPFSGPQQTLERIVFWILSSAANDGSPLVQPAVTHLPTIGQSETNSEITNQELEPDTLDPTTGYKYPSLGTT